MVTDPLVDILSKETAYLHVSTPDARTLIYDISGCYLISTKINPDETLFAWRDGEEIALQPMKRDPAIIP